MSKDMDTSHEEELVLLHDKEWEKQQIRSFGAWTNSHVKKVGEEIVNICTDLQNGKLLLKLLEVISGELLPKPEKGNLRVHHVNNVNQCIKFLLKKGLKLANIGPEEIVDGNVKMTLGLIWTIILRFAINVDIEGFSAKDGLLLWAKRCTEGYKGCNVKNFTSSWQDGLAFCAIIHRHRPDLLDYSKLSSQNAADNLNLAFDIAEKELDIPRMLDVESIMTVPDDKSVMTYLSSYYHAFSSSQQLQSAARRINRVIDIDSDIQKKIEAYERLSPDLLEWIEKKTTEFHDHGDENPKLEDLLQRSDVMDQYKKNEKPKRSDEKAMLEDIFNTIKTKLYLLNRPEYIPRVGFSPKEINERWKGMEKEEKDLLDYLQMKLQQLYYLEHLLKKFYYKCDQQTMWMSQRTATIEGNFPEMSLSEIQSKKKAILILDNEVSGRNSRTKAITSLYQKILDLKSTEEAKVTERYNEVLNSWNDLKSKCESSLKAIKEREEYLRMVDDLQLEYARKVPEIKAFIDDGVEDMNDIFQAQSISDILGMKDELAQFISTFEEFEKKVQELEDLYNKIQSLTQSPNPYSSTKPSDVKESYASLKELAAKRKETLESEHMQQKSNDDLKKKFAEFADKIEVTRADYFQKIQSTTAGTTLSRLEDAVSKLSVIAAEIEGYYKSTFPAVEEMTNSMHAAKIYSNPYTSHTGESISNGYQSLMHLLSSNKNEVENQILIRDTGKLSEQQVKDYKKSFDYFDKNHINELTLEEFRSFLVSLGFNVSTDDKSGDNKEFLRILNSVDTEKVGRITFNNFLNWIASESKDSDTADQIIDSFRILAGGLDYITPDIIRREFPSDRAESIISRMEPSNVSGAPAGSLDYRSFAATFYGETDL